SSSACCLASRMASAIFSATGRQNAVCCSVDIDLSLLAVSEALRSRTPWVSIAWNHSGGWTVPSLARSLRRSSMGVFLPTACFQMQAALMMQRMDGTLPNWLSRQLAKELSNMAMPVADSTRGYGFWPNATTFHFAGGLGLSAWNVSSRTGTM